MAAIRTDPSSLALGTANVGGETTPLAFRLYCDDAADTRYGAFTIVLAGTSPARLNLSADSGATWAGWGANLTLPSTTRIDYTGVSGLRIKARALAGDPYPMAASLFIYQDGILATTVPITVGSAGAGLAAAAITISGTAPLTLSAVGTGSAAAAVVPAFAQATGLAASGQGPASIPLAWTAVTGASVYQVDRATAYDFATGKVTLTTTVGTNAYTNNATNGNAPANDTIYYYRVRAGDGAGNWGAWSVWIVTACGANLNDSCADYTTGGWTADTGMAVVSGSSVNGAGSADPVTPALVGTDSLWYNNTTPAVTDLDVYRSLAAIGGTFAGNAAKALFFELIPRCSHDGSAYMGWNTYTAGSKATSSAQLGAWRVLGFDAGSMGICLYDGASTAGFITILALASVVLGRKYFCKLETKAADGKLYGTVIDTVTGAIYTANGTLTSSVTLNNIQAAIWGISTNASNVPDAAASTPLKNSALIDGVYY